jgi:hypothetical protein
VKDDTAGNDDEARDDAAGTGQVEIDRTGPGTRSSSGCGRSTSGSVGALEHPRPTADGRPSPGDAVGGVELWAAPPLPSFGVDHAPDEVVTSHAAHPVGAAPGDPAEGLRRANPRAQGVIGVADAIAWFSRRGWCVSIPLIDAQPYDLVVDAGAGPQRVQVKTVTYRSPYGVFVVSLETRGGNQSFHTGKPFDPDAVELLYVLTDDGTRYLIPTTVVRSRTTISLGERVAEYRVPA